MEFNNCVIWNLQPCNSEFDARVIYGYGGRQVIISTCKSHSVTSAPQASSSTLNSPNRLCDGANVYLTSAELATVGGILGRLPTPAEYMEYASKIDSMSAEVYRYMNFDQIESFQKSAEEGKLIAAQQIVEVTGA